MQPRLVGVNLVFPRPYGRGYELLVCWSVEHAEKCYCTAGILPADTNTSPNSTRKSKPTWKLLLSTPFGLPPRRGDAEVLYSKFWILELRRFPV